MLDQNGRKALIVMTDGVDEGSEADLATSLDATQKADTLIYSILFADAGFYGLGGGREGRGVLGVYFVKPVAASSKSQSIKTSARFSM